EIVSATGSQGVNVSARNLSNFRPSNAMTSLGTISVSGGISASGVVTNAGIIALGTNLSAAGVSNFGSISLAGDLTCSGDLMTYADSTMTLKTLNVSGNTSNAGSITGTTLHAGNTLSGAGVWKFTTATFSDTQTVTLGSNVTFHIDSLFNNGTGNVGQRYLNLTGKTR